jgi:hypothetical protein
MTARTVFAATAVCLSVITHARASAGVVPPAKARRIAAQWGGRVTYLPTWAPAGVAAAKRAIARRHCRTGRVAYATSTKRSGVVIAQRRRAGRILPPRSKIDLVVSRGR